MKKHRRKAEKRRLIQEKKRRLLEKDRLIQKKLDMVAKRKKIMRLLLNRLKSTNLFLTVKDIPIENREQTSDHPTKKPTKEHRCGALAEGSPGALEKAKKHCDSTKAHSSKYSKHTQNGLSDDMQKLSLKAAKSSLVKISDNSSNKKVATKLLKPLSHAALKKVDEVLNSRSRVIIEAFNIAIHKDDILRLRDKQWLNDELINFYGTLILERAKSLPDQYPSVHVFNTFFYPLLLEHGYTKVQRWTRKVDLFSKELVIIPVHLGVHWCCAIINMKLKRFEYYDPLLSGNPRCLKALRNYLQEEAKSKKHLGLDLSEWANHTPKNIPRQENGYDCGVFSCQYAEYASRCAPFTFSQRDMLQLRKQMIYEIASAKLIN